MPWFCLNQRLTREGCMSFARSSESVQRRWGVDSTSSRRPRSQSGAAPKTSSGWHRLQGLKPAESASEAVLKKSTFSRFGLRAGQVGRHIIPVDRTPTKNWPSYSESRSHKARYMVSGDGIFSAGVFMPTFYGQKKQTRPKNEHGTWNPSKR